MLSFDGWSVGIAYCLKIIIDLIFSTFFILKAKKNKLPLLYFPVFAMISYLLAYIPYVVDFFNILTTGLNIQFLPPILLWITTWETIASILAIFLGSKLCLSKYKRFVILFYLAYFIIATILLIMIPSLGFMVNYPSSPGENIIKPYLPVNSTILYGAIYWIIDIYFAYALFLKSSKLKGKVRKKYQSLALAYLSGIIFWIFISITIDVGFIYAIFFLIFGSLVWLSFYYGLTPVKEHKTKKKKTPTDDELKFVSYLMKKPTSNQAIEDESLVSSKLDKDILVFVSYSSKDSKIYKVREIAEQLKIFPGMKDVLFYEGESFDNIIKYMNDNLGLCDAFLLFCSQNALNSVPIEKEWTAAEAMGVPIIPIFFDLKHIPPLLKSRLGVEYDFYNLDQTVKEIYSAILKRCIETA